MAEIPIPIQKKARIQLATRHLYDFCRLMFPNFYRKDRPYLKDMCYKIENFLENSDKHFLVLNAPPRHGKSITAQCTSAWLFGRNPEYRVMTGSYNERLASIFSRNVRNMIQTVKVGDNIVYSDIFPETNVKYGEASAQMWTIDGQSQTSYLATSPNGTATGFGCECLTGDTKILTSHGWRKMRDIYNDKNIVQTLSLCYNKVEHNAIVAKKKTKKRTVYEITLSDGSSVKATENHKFYVKGQGWKTVSWILRNMQQANREIQRQVPSMLRQDEAESNRIYLRILPQEIQSPRLRNKKARLERYETKILLKKLLTPSQCDKTADEILSVWETYSNFKKYLLLRGMQKEISKLQDAESDKLFILWKRISTDLPSNEILFDELQEPLSFNENVGRRKFKLQKQKFLPDDLSKAKRADKGKRWKCLSALWGRRQEQFCFKTWRNNKPNNSSSRPRQAEQSSRQFDNTLQKMPSNYAYVVRVRKCLVKRTVYDLQVEKNHNFFANGIFTHNCLIMDDLIRSAEEAYNENVLDDIYSWFTNTMLSRLEGKRKCIIIMTRWAEKDLAGRIINAFKDDIELLTYKAQNDDGTMLCDSILDAKSYEFLKQEMNEDIIQANYNQKPIDVGGRLYNEFKIWEERPDGVVKNFTDTADTGSDYLCSINYIVYENEAYITDLVFTDKPMEYTEQAVSDLLFRDSVNESVIESNNGGRGFARNVERLLKETHNTNKTIISSQPQTHNKESRILASSAWVQNHVYMPKGWRNRFPEFYQQVMSYQRKGKNAHDDSCFPAGTKVATTKGDINIEKVKIGDKVITPFGVKKVINAGFTGKKNVIYKDGFTATPNHKFFDGKTFTRLDVFKGVYDTIDRRSLLKWRYKRLLYLMEKNTVLWGRESIILANQVQIKEERILKDFMLRFGNFITRKKFRKAMSFTIKTVIALITTFLTWSVYRLMNIKVYTLYKKKKDSKKKNTSNISLKSVLLHQNGIKANKEKCGTKCKPNKDGRKSRTKNYIVNFVTKSSKAHFQTQDSALTYVGRNIEEETVKGDSAKSVTKILQKKMQGQSIVQKNANISQSKKENLVDVYNITVEDVGCFYANGVLVSNCDVLASIYEDITNDRKMQFFSDYGEVGQDRVFQLLD